MSHHVRKLKTSRGFTGFIPDIFLAGGGDIQQPAAAAEHELSLRLKSMQTATGSGFYQRRKVCYHV